MPYIYPGTLSLHDAMWWHKALTVPTNIFILPAAWFSFRHGFYLVTLFGIFGPMASVFYHVAERSQYDGYGIAIILGLDEAKWHQIDNVLCTSGLSSLLLALSTLSRRNINYLLLSTTMWSSYLQLVNPWDINSVLKPVSLILVLCLLNSYVTATMHPQLSRGIGARSNLIVTGMLLISGVLFAKGSDEFTDTARIYHGLWHVLSGISGSFIIHQGFGWRERTGYGLDKVKSE